MANEQNNIVKLIEAAGKRKEAENKFKLELIKAKLQSKLKQQEQSNFLKQQYMLNNAKEESQNRIKNPQQYTPEQQYLRRRFMEENPLTAMMIPTEGGVQEGQNIGITFPQQEITRDDKSGMYASQPLTQDRQASLLLTKVDQMLARGERPHPIVMKVAEKMRENLQRKAELRAAGIKPSVSANKYSGADAKIVSQAEALTGKLQTLKNMIGTPDEQYLPWGLGAEGAQEFQALKDDVKSTLLYLRSGAAVTPQEAKRLEQLLPKFLRRKRVDTRQLDRFIEEFSAIAERIKQGRRYDEISGSFYDVEGSGKSMEVDGDEVEEGTTATNPDTNERIVYQNGEWVPLDEEA